MRPVGVVGGGAFEYARSQWTDAAKLRNRRLVATYNVRAASFMIRKPHSRLFLDFVIASR